MARGEVIVLPTDTVYGLACAPERVESIFEIKQRPPDRNVQLLVPDVSWLHRAGRASADAEALADAFWPGPLTLVVAASPGAPAALAGNGTIGLRVPDHDVALEVLARTGGLAASSANRSGDPTPATLAAIAEIFGDAVGALLDGGEIAGSGSTVVDLTGAEARILRAGPVSEADVTRVLRRSIPGAI